jgi:hypothetical protein
MGGAKAAIRPVTALLSPSRERIGAVALAVIGLSLQWRAGAAFLKGSVMGSH